MADKLSLELEKREVLGKAVKRLRREGWVPAVIHDHGKPSIVVSAEFLAITKTYSLAGKHHPVQLKADGKTYTALIKKVDSDPRTNFITHVVFNAVNANQKVEAEIPVKPRYAEGNDSSPAERASLIVLGQLDSVEVAAKPNDLPDVIYYDAEKLAVVGDQVTVADLIAPTGVEIKAEAEHVVATVFEPSALQAANDAAGGDAEAGDEAEVASEHESTATADGQADEIRPGGKKEFEDKEQGHNPEKK